MKITRKDMRQLKLSLIDLRDKHETGGLTEHDVWELLDKSERMLDASTDGEHEEELKVIYSMLSIVWKNIRQVDELRRLLV